MNKWMDTCVDRWVSGWLCGRRKSLRKSIKFSGEQLWHSNSSLLLPSIAPLPGAHPISPVLQVHLSVGEMVQESVSWRWQELIYHSQAGPAPLGANHSSMGWRLQDREQRPRLVTLLHASQAPPPEFWQRGFPTMLPYYHSVEHPARYIVDAQ